MVLYQILVSPCTVRGSQSVCRGQKRAKNHAVFGFGQVCGSAWGGCSGHVECRLDVAFCNATKKGGVLLTQCSEETEVAPGRCFCTDGLPAIVLHVCRWFPVTHLAKDAGDLLELSAHSSTP